MVIPTGNMPPGRAPRATEVRSRHLAVLVSLSKRHQRRLRRQNENRSRTSTEAEQSSAGAVVDLSSAAADAKQSTETASNPTKKKAAKYRAKLTTPDMEFKRGIEPRNTANRVDTAEGKEAVDRVSEAIETALTMEIASEQTSEALAASAHASVAAAIGDIRKRPTPPTKQKRPRGLLQDDNEGDNEDEADDISVGHGDAVGDHDDADNISDENGDDDEATVPYIPPVCVVEGDPNLMSGGARQCTGLNSDDDSDADDEDDLPDSLCLSVAKNASRLRVMKESGWGYDPDNFGPDPTYAADLYDGPYGPSDSVLAVAEDPLALFFYFLPPRLWTQIAVETNRYHTESIPARARSIQVPQRQKGEEVENYEDVRRRLANVQTVEAWQVLRAVGLLIARMLSPMRKRIAAHWSVSNPGALPANRFGKFMSRNRFFHILGNLHFSNNKSPQANTDRAWKIRPVVDVLQRTFSCGYKVPPVISFDEATLPSRSRYNPTRQFNKVKPHKWGTKMFVAACADTAYCMRFVTRMCVRDEYQLDAAFFLAQVLMLN
ncbi:hypothetical protein PC118_g22094 [Phytophthora cactorum]|uniref:PiggyBac transposable element-derived protein domain-containing protein n=1 Tax=Phytophthora cactorum TaxID=29920 RepID=A0A8T1CS24_9STRA|nr:hypothetical protein PC117_g14442 [Phytophthora cactorum]KAG2961210.1 hypothetical protein PC118_g22094 [Phytophthora cactorum]KAG2974056.1 hypothetical protein PC119_g22762 [Phytophthora cactorum]KAG3076456.1 hypothetical protein PC122_g13563 [Phytophthora cactorum]